MKKIIVFTLVIFTLAARGAEKKKIAPETAVPATAGKNTVPAKPVVPEKKQPYELWMTAHTEALKAAQQKKYDEALALLDTPVRKDRNTPYHKARVMLMRGELLMQSGKYDEAAAEWEKVMQTEEKNWITTDAAIHLGNLCYLRKDAAGAVRYFRTILNDTSRLPGLRSKALLAEVEMLQKEKKFAEGIALIETFGQIEQLPPGRQLDLAFARSRFQIALKDLKGARATLDQAMKIPGKPAPYLASLYSRMAEIFFLQKRYREAQNMMQRARSVRGHEWGYNKGFHNEINMAVAKENRERALRERKIRQERQRKARLEKERKARLERQRKAAKKTGKQK